MSDLVRLRELASKATPGPWSAHDGIGTTVELHTGHEGRKCACGQIWSKPHDCIVAAAIGARDETYTLGEGVSDEQLARNAAFIAAANPQTMLALLDRIERLEAFVGKVREASKSKYVWGGAGYDENFENAMDAVDQALADLDRANNKETQ